ncbi:glyoxylate/hydroxypyruvate reductase A-like [Mya arenaria]|uniref:glyoxylate/hydroxypyruvate reductase A-like n=1 Tax=Mya arenaria TaxID=6604 RepID=UPI0022E44DD2|nr:glyoxylate/hydroxypyruvate reductase A-like [Mya arenaria]
MDASTGSGISVEDKAMIEDSADILLADVPVIIDVANTANKLKWAASTWAGVENLIKAMDSKKPPNFPITRMGEAFNIVMAEYVLGYILAKERFIIELAREQETATWNKSDYSNYRCLSDLTVSVLGVGEIGKQVSCLLSTVGVKVIGVTRTIPSEEQKNSAVSQYRTIDDLAEVLSESDYVINILPSTPQTQGLLSKDMFSHCKRKKSVFINIGRGDVTDEESLVKAIKSDWLGGAVLDVFREEPLPQSSPLWTLPGVIITPHVAGVSLSHLVAKSFKNNYERYNKGEPLNFVVDFERGY